MLSAFTEAGNGEVCGRVFLTPPLPGGLQRFFHIKTVHLEDSRKTSLLHGMRAAGLQLPRDKLPDSPPDSS